MVRAYRRERLGEAGGDLAEAVEAAGERARELHERTRTAEFRRDGWLIHGSLLIEVDRLLAGLGDRA
ncbi:hypothetical protein [Spirillospora sp. CA-294931]|uniref:hypothetical protein n=1 Tax=Spirillospora sp. CA-294931 TaxID=3240042 RepID=UPI003D8D85C0